MGSPLDRAPRGKEPKPPQKKTHRADVCNRAPLAKDPKKASCLICSTTGARLDSAAEIAALTGPTPERR